MKFFVPGSTNIEEANKVYNCIKIFAKQTTGWQIYNTKIFSIMYKHNGVKYSAEVNKISKLNKELVVTILESKD